MRFASILNFAAAATALWIPEWFQSELLENNKAIPGLRLVELAGGDRKELSEEEILELKRQSINFMDITEHADDTFITVSDEVSFPKELKQQAKVRKLASQLSKENLETVLTKFSSFFTRYAKSQYGVQSTEWLYDQITKTIGDRKDISVTQFSHSWLQNSLIARFEGSESPETIVVVGAHLDSLNLILPSLMAAPGADDDGSGTTTIFEVFRVLAQSGYVPKNTLEFHWYSAEELGLLGSQDVFASYASGHKDVKAMLQQDCTGYSAGTTSDGSPDSMGLITDYVHQGLTDYVKVLIAEYCDIPYVETECGYACSDHASAGKYGYPSSFVIESEFSKSNTHMHTTQDTVDKLDFDHMLQHAKLTLGYAVELGNNKF